MDIRRLRSIGRLFGAVLFAGAASVAIPASAAAQSGGFSPLRPDGNGVPALARTVTLNFENATAAEVIREVMRQADLDLVYRADLPGLDRRVSMHESRITSARALLRALDGSGLRVVVGSGGQAVVVTAADPRGVAAVPAAVAGIVREAGGGPISQVDVEMAGRRAVTDSEGRFRVRDVPVGEHVLRAKRLGYRDASVESVRVEAGIETNISIEMISAPTPLAAVVVTPGHFGMLEESVAAKQSLSREDIETRPQLGDDIFRAVHRLPGVSSHDLSAAFSVRGGAHSEVLVKLDGIELVEPFHLKDLEGGVSIIDIGSIGGVDLITGGFGAEYANRLTGVFDMRTQAVAPGGARTSLGISLTNLRAATQGAFAEERGRWLFAVRRGYLDLALALGDGNTAISPTYYDIIGKVQYALTPRAVLSAHVLHAGDRLSYDEEDDPSEPKLESEYGSSYAWINLDAPVGGRASVRTVLSAGKLDWERLGDRTRDPRSHGALEVEDRRSYDFTGVRQEWSLELGERAVLKAGFDARRGSAQYDYFAWREKWRAQDGRVIAEFDTTTATASPTGTMLGAYVAQRIRPWQPLVVELGGEWSRHSHTGDSRVNPRINFALAAGRTTLRGAWGRYSQAQGLHELQTRDGVTQFLPAERAQHRVLSVEHALGRGFDVRVEAYERLTDDLRPRFVNFDNVDDMLPEIARSRRRIDVEEGRARGLELIARRAGSRFDWSATYALASTEERLAGTWVPAPRDQRHAVGLDFSWVPAPNWRLAAAWQYHTGWPRTPQVVQGELLDDGGYWFTWDYGAYNSARLPPYHRLDVRASRQFETRRGRVSVFIDIWNVYNRENARSIVSGVYDVRNGQPLVWEGVDAMIPRLPSFGIYWEF